MLNKEQKIAVESESRLLIVLAGPGSGKTRVIVEKLKYLVEKKGVPAENILALSFTNKAANEVRERFSVNQNPFLSNKIWISTFHSLGLNILRNNQKATPLKPNFLLVDSDDSKKILKNVMENLGLSFDKKEFRDVLTAISNFRNDSAVLDLETHKIYDAYRRKMNDLNAIDYDDILTLTLKLLKENSEIRNKYIERFSYLLIDEFQDTNKVQHDIVSLFINNNKQTILVGDIDQSIYGWRNARPDHMVSLLSKGEVVHLTGNYRSKKPIVELCNNLIANNMIPGRKPMFSAHSDQDDEPVEFRKFIDSRNEVKAMVSIVKNKEGSKAILIRTNAMSREIEEELNLQAVPYSLVGGTRFYERREIKDALAYIRFTLNPFDALSFERIVNTPRRKIGAKTLARIQEFSFENKKDFLTSIKECLPDSHGSLDFYKSIQELNKLLDIDLKKALKYVFEDIGLLNYYRTSNEFNKEDEGGVTSLDRVENLKELISAVEQFSTKPVAYLDGIEEEYDSPRTFAVKFLENASINSSKEDDNSANLKIMTIHSAKGKEFDTVWVPALEEGLLPHYLTDEQPDVEEERRLLFVACSRARNKLYLSASSQRLKYGKLNSNTLSRFFSEIKPTLAIFDEGQHFGVNRWSRDVKEYSPVLRSGSLSIEEIQSLKSGEIVTHPVFGKGVVTAIEEGTATIKFGETSRIMNLRIAPLKIFK